MNVTLEATTEAVPGMSVRAVVRGIQTSHGATIQLVLVAADTIKPGDLLRQPIPGVAVRASVWSGASFPAEASPPVEAQSPS